MIFKIDSIYSRLCVQNKWVFFGCTYCLKEKILVYNLVFESNPSLQNNLIKNELLIHVDYSESYGNKQQREIQSVYFGHTRFSIFTMCCHLRDAKNKMICESITISELSDHSRAAATTSVLTVIDHLREKYQHLPLKINFYME